MKPFAEVWRESASVHEPPALLVALVPGLAGQKVDEATSKLTLEDVVAASYKVDDPTPAVSPAKPKRK